jgi:hypothetical protein
VTETDRRMRSAIHTGLAPAPMRGRIDLRNDVRHRTGCNVLRRYTAFARR